MYKNYNTNTNLIEILGGNELAANSSVSKKISVLSNFQDVESIMNSKFAPLFFQILNEAIKDKLKDKINLRLREQKRKSNPWRIIYENSIVKQKDLLPKIVYKYILKKAKDKFHELIKESQKYNKKREDFISHYMKQCQKFRRKIVDKKRIEGIELEHTNYFNHGLQKKSGFKFIANLSKRFKTVMAKGQINSRFICSLFNLNQKVQDIQEIDSSSEEEAQEIYVKCQIDKIKKQIIEEKIKIENEKKVNRKFVHIKSRLLSPTSISSKFKLNESNSPREIIERKTFKFSTEKHKKNPSMSRNFLYNSTNTNATNCTTTTSTKMKHSVFKIENDTPILNIKNYEDEHPVVNMNDSKNQLTKREYNVDNFHSEKLPNILPDIFTPVDPVKTKTSIFRNKKKSNTHKMQNNFNEYFIKSDFYYK